MEQDIGGLGHCEWRKFPLDGMGRDALIRSVIVRAEEVLIGLKSMLNNDVDVLTSTNIEDVQKGIQITQSIIDDFFKEEIWQKEANLSSPLRKEIGSAKTLMVKTYLYGSASPSIEVKTDSRLQQSQLVESKSRIEN